MAKNIGHILQTAMISAFTLVTAFIWRDVIIEFIEVIFPAQELLYKFFAAVITTVIAILAIYIFLQTEHEAHIVIAKLKHKDKKLLHETKKEVSDFKKLKK